MFDRMNPSVTITKPLQRFNDNLMYLEAECVSETAECPKQNEIKVMGRKGPRPHSAAKKKDAYTTFQVRDMYDSGEKIFPCLIVYKVQKWKCITCKTLFLDPETQYRGHRKTSEDFRKYLAQTFLSDVKLDIEHLMDGYELSESTVREILKEYRDEYERTYFFNPPCKEVWVMPFGFHRKVYLIVFGTLRQNGDLAILGICDDYSMEAVYNKFGFCNATHAPDRMFLPIDLYCSEYRNDFEIKCLDDDDDDDVKISPLIYDVLDLIESFEERRHSFDMMQLRIEFCDQFRRSVVRQMGIGTFLRSKMGYAPNAMLAFTQHRFCLCEERYAPNNDYVPLVSLDPLTRENLMGEYGELPLEVECSYIDAESLVSSYNEELIHYEPYLGESPIDYSNIE